MMFEVGDKVIRKVLSQNEYWVRMCNKGQRQPDEIFTVEKVKDSIYFYDIILKELPLSFAAERFEKVDEPVESLKEWL